VAKKEFTADERAAYAAKQQAETEEMFRRIDEGVSEVFTSEKYLEYLKFASKFTDYSARNTMLINMQRPDATFVGAFGTWKKLGRYVDKGEKGIEILAPVKYNTNQYEEYEQPAKDEFGNQLYNDDGTEKMETVQKAVTGLAFKPAYVFDLSQTSGKDIPDPFTELQGDIDTAKKEAIFTALRKITGIRIDFEDIKGGAKGYYSPMQDRIVIKSGMSDLQTIKTAIHETAHNLLHDPDKKIVTAKSPRNEKEVQAESVAYMVSERFGMDTSEYSFPYIASWSEGKQKAQLMNVLQEIQDASKTICSAIESELLKMRKRDLSIEEKLSDTELNNIQKAEFIIEDCEDKGVIFSKEDIDDILSFAGDNEDIQETVKYVSDMERIYWQRESYGYDFSAMIPLKDKATALQAFDNGEAVYLLYPDNTEGLAENRYEIEAFDGFFGIEKEDRERSKTNDENLIAVSKEVALDMWDKDLDVFIDGVPAFSREDIENAPPEAQIFLAEYQYSAELDFDMPARGNRKDNKMDYRYNSEQRSAPAKNPNILGNTPYAELGAKGSLAFFANLKNRHADNIAAQLDADGVRFSGVRKGDTTTITVNKADVSRYEAAVEKVKASYRTADRQKPESSPEPARSSYGAPRTEAPPQSRSQYSPQQNARPINPNVIGNTPYAELGARSQLTYFTNLKNRHADNIAAQLDADGVRFSGLRKGDVTTITINKADVAQYEAAVEKVKASYRMADTQKTDSYPEPTSPAYGYSRDEHVTPHPPREEPQQESRAANPNVIGNTPYSELGERSQLTYFTNLKNRHADNIAAQLDADGVRFSGLRKGTVTTITINKADISRYEAAVEKVKASYRSANVPRGEMIADKPKVPKPIKPDIPEKRPDLPDSIKNVPICTKSYLEAKQSGEEQAWRSSVAASKACIKYLNDNLYEAYESRNLKGLVKDMEDRFGLERTMYTIAATIQLKDHDGRFTGEVRKRAGQFNFDSDNTRLNFLTEQHPVKLNHLFQVLIEREKELAVSAPELSEKKLPSHLTDKFLYPTERVEVRDDYRGVPETTFYQSSANQYFVTGYGWLDDHNYDMQQKQSGLTAKEFADKIVMVNANYITPDGQTGQVDMTKQEYDMLTEKTYAPEYRVAFEAAKAALSERLQGHDVKLSTEYFAVRQRDADKYEVCTIGGKGDVAVVKGNIPTISEAKKLLLEIYKEHISSARVELLHPHDLQEKADEIKRTMPEIRHEPNFEIYQLKANDENAEICFRPMDELLKMGKKPKFSAYEMVYQGNTADLKINGETLAQTLESFFRKFNIDHPDDFKGHSLSVSDVVVLQDKAYYVDRVGFKVLGNFLPPEREQNRFVSELPAMIADLSDKSDIALSESVESIYKRAGKLGIKPEMLREAFYMSPDNRVVAAAEQYEMHGKVPAAPAPEAPKQEKPVTNKKLKL